MRYALTAVSITCAWILFWVLACTLAFGATESQICDGPTWVQDTAECEAHPGTRLCEAGLSCVQDHASSANGRCLPEPERCGDTTSTTSTTHRVTTSTTTSESTTTTVPAHVAFRYDVDPYWNGAHFVASVPSYWPQAAMFDAVEQQTALCGIAALYQKMVLGDILYSTAFTALNGVLPRMRTELVYQGGTRAPHRKAWPIGESLDGAPGHYKGDRKCLQTRDVALKDPACAANLQQLGAAGVALAHWLDVHPDDDTGACLPGVEAPDRPAEDYWQSEDPQASLMDTHRDFPPATPEEVAVLDRLCEAHNLSSDILCGLAAPAHVDPHAVLAEYESMNGGDPQKAAFHRMCHFFGTVDPAWSPKELCAITRLSDVFICGATAGNNPSLLPEFGGLDVSWRASQLIGSWPMAQGASLDHALTHTMRNVKPTVKRPLFAKFPCIVVPLGGGVGAAALDCDKEDWMTWLYEDDQGMPRVDWLTANDPQVWTTP